MSSEIQIENDDVRVTRWTLRQGEHTGEHRHEHDYVVVPLTTARMHVRLQDGTESITELVPGRSYHRAAGAVHDVRNEDPDVVDFVEVEILRGDG